MIVPLLAVDGIVGNKLEMGEEERPVSSDYPMSHCIEDKIVTIELLSH